MKLRYRWLDIATCALVSAAAVGFVASIMERIPA